MTEPSSSAAYTIPSHTVTNIGRWHLVADAASSLWVAKQPDIVIPKISVDAKITTNYFKDIVQHTLTLTYVIVLSPDANDSKVSNTTANQIINNTSDNNQSGYITPWFTWLPLASQLEQTKPVDFLWQNTCLECFLAGTTSDIQPSDSQQYIEMNIASNGQHAIYHFDDYRTPETMPPRRLTALPIIQNYLQANLDETQQRLPALLTVNSTANIDDIVITNKTTVFTRQISLNLSPLTNIWNSLSLIHPTVILQHRSSQQQIFFASKHANPADFHQQQLWSSINFPL